MREEGGPVAAVLQSQAHTAGLLSTDERATVSARTAALALTETDGHIMYPSSLFNSAK